MSWKTVVQLVRRDFEDAIINLKVVSKNLAEKLQCKMSAYDLPKTGRSQPIPRLQQIFLTEYRTGYPQFWASKHSSKIQQTLN